MECPLWVRDDLLPQVEEFLWALFTSRRLKKIGADAIPVCCGKKRAESKSEAAEI